MPKKKTRLIHRQRKDKNRVISLPTGRRVLHRQFFTGVVEKDRPYNIWDLIYFIHQTHGGQSLQINGPIELVMDRARRARRHIANELDNQQRREAIVWWQDYNRSRIALAKKDLTIYGYETVGNKGLSTMWAYTDIDSKLYKEKAVTKHHNEVRRHINAVYRENRPILEMENVSTLEQQEAAHRISSANNYQALLSGKAHLVDDDKLLFIAQAAVEYDRGNLTKVMEATYPEFKDKVLAELEGKYKLEPKDIHRALIQ